MFGEITLRESRERIISMTLPDIYQGWEDLQLSWMIHMIIRGGLSIESHSVSHGVSILLKTRKVHFGLNSRGEHAKV